MNNLTHCLKDSVAICYNGGAYGTYLEWALTTLTTPGDISAPFTAIGNSHKFMGNLLIFEKLEQKILPISAPQWIRLHPKTKKDHSLSNNLNSILNSTKQIIYLYPDTDSVLLNINNYFNKIWKDWWGHQFATDISPEKIYNNWPVANSVTLDQIPLWIQREFLSYYLMPAWQAQIEWYHPAHYADDRCLVVLINELLYNFEQTLNRIKHFCNIEFLRPITDLIPYHDTMLSLQKNIDQDQLCNKIINCTITDLDYVWGHQLPLPSQAWVQWQLRNLGYEIQCDGLDLFPENSVQLKKIMYKT